MSSAPRPLRSDARRRRELILSAAIELFQTHGASVSLEAIAEHAGVGIATLYRNFSDRKTLIEACTVKVAQEFLAFQQQTVAELEQNPARADELIRAYADHLLHLRLTLLVPTFLPHDLTELNPELAQLRVELKEQGDRVMELFRGHGAAGPGVSHLEFVTGVLFVARPHDTQVDTLQPNIEQRVVDIFLAGVKAGAAPVQR